MAAIDALRPHAESIRWVEPHNLHWTVQFLGDLSDREMAEVCLRAVRAAARHASFELEARGVGAFPSIHRPRTLWLGAGEGAQALRALHADIDDALRDLGFRGEARDFVPHLTLGRTAAHRPSSVRAGGQRGGRGRAGAGAPPPRASGGAAEAPSRDPAALTAALAQLSDFDGGVMAVDQVLVFASDLTPEGPEYTVLAHAPLG